MSGWAVSPFPWFGGKQRLARRIVDLLPAHSVYVEPFGGAAAVLLSKRAARLEVYNDVDEGLLAFFKVLRDEPDELERRLRLTPFARREFELCRDTWREQDDPIEKARRWYVRVEQAFAGTPTTMGWGGEFLGRRRQSRATSSWKRLDRMYAIAARFRTVQIEGLDWRQVLDRYDQDDVVFYLDPPYVLGTRKPRKQRGGKTYSSELSDDDHAELVARALALRGNVLLSGYDHELYRPLEDAGFERLEFAAIAASASTHAGGEGACRIEVLWRRTHEISLFDDWRAAAA